MKYIHWILYLLIVGLLVIILYPVYVSADEVYVPLKHSKITQIGNLPQIQHFVATEAHKYGIDPKIALYVASQESDFNPKAVGDHGTSFGIWQIHNPQEKGMTIAQAEDIEFSTEWAMKTMITDGGCFQWSTCPN